MGDISETQQSEVVRITDGDETLIASISSNNELNVTDGIKTQIINSSLVVGLTSVEVKVGASRLASRKGIILYNNSNRTMFWGGSGVTIANGIPLNKGESITIRNEDVSLFVVSDTADQDARILEFR